MHRDSQNFCLIISWFLLIDNLDIPKLEVISFNMDMYLIINVNFKKRGLKVIIINLSMRTGIWFQNYFIFSITNGKKILKIDNLENIFNNSIMFLIFTIVLYQDTIKVYLENLIYILHQLWQTCNPITPGNIWNQKNKKNAVVTLFDDFFLLNNSTPGVRIMLKYPF